MKRIKSLALLSALLLMASSCGISYESLSLQIMKPSVSGVDLRQKSVACFTLYNNQYDSTALVSVLAKSMDRMSEEYSKDIPLYALPCVKGADYSDRDSLAALLTLANVDVLMLAVPDDSASESEGFGFKIYCYDSMSPSDNVYTLSELTANALAPTSTVNRIVTYFGPVWQSGVFHVIYYEGRDDWNNALTMAESGMWTAAIDKWMEILQQTDDIHHRMAAEYNIALGCYLLGNYTLADKWAEQAASDSLGGKPDYLKDLQKKIKKML